MDHCCTLSLFANASSSTGPDAIAGAGASKAPARLGRRRTSCGAPLDALLAVAGFSASRDAPEDGVRVSPTAHDAQTFHQITSFLAVALTDGNVGTD